MNPKFWKITTYISDTLSEEDSELGPYSKQEINTYMQVYNLPEGLKIERMDVEEVNEVPTIEIKEESYQDKVLRELNQITKEVLER